MTDASNNFATTIFALSSGTGRAGVAVIRVSGPNARMALELMAPPLPPAREIALRTIRDHGSGRALDRGVVFWFAAPRSETSEDVAEFQVHGGPAVIRAVLAALGQIPDTRLAEPGEFARRAFHNGKLDLAEVEGLADLIDAETEAQRQQALAQAGGALSKLYDGWRQRLIEIAGLVEAAIDFSDEGDVSASAFTMARQRIEPLLTEIRAHLDDGHRGEILRDGFRVALVGPPNVGKSSLLNALARRDAAIVSAEPGTTRDVIEVRLDLGGVPVIVSDTAGLRRAAGAIEQEGMRRSVAAARQANLVLWLNTEADSASTLEFSRETQVKVRTKIDLLTDSNQSQSAPSDAEFDFAISSLTGAGLDALIGEIKSRAVNAVGPLGNPAMTQARHRQNLEAARNALADFMAGDSSALELRAEDVRLATHALGRITGRVDVEDVLGQIFSRFCIGK